MRVSLKWLKELVDVDMPVEQLVDRLDMTGTKVERVIKTGQALDGVVVGQVLVKEQHPNADKLSYCQVDVGAQEPLRIVCGATNFSEGDKVPVALVGATLPGGVTIKRAKLRGLESEGMMCSARELGAGSDASGLLILPKDAPVGASYAEYAGLADTVLELEVTPNRPDCLSMAGVAREVGAVLNRDVRFPQWDLRTSGEPVEKRVSVVVEDPDLCPRYTARLIRGVRIGPSPDWLAERIVAAGARPINNVVDVTNYVLFELGQPLHAFDLATIAAPGGVAKVIVRRANDGERLRTLDGQDRVLSPDMLVIADANGPVALAGVMGGEATEVSERTVDVLLEAASFDRASVSKTSRTLGLLSESSLRFERGVDPELAARASERAAALIAELGGGEVAPGLIDVYPSPVTHRSITLRCGRMNAFLGTAIARDEAAAILRRLGIASEATGEDLACTVPTFRPDLEREVDLYEEVVRIWGMERVPSTLPGGRQRVGGLDASQRIERRIGATMRAAGLNEHIGLAFEDPRRVEACGFELGPDEALVELLNPMSNEQSHLRVSTLTGLLEAVSRNQRRGVSDVHLYEVGRVFRTSSGRKLPKERTVLGAVLSGSWDRQQWYERPRPLDFFDAKGVLEALFESLRIERWRLDAAEHAWLQPGRSADVVVRGEVIGWLGEVAPHVLKTFEVDGAVAAFEVDVRALVRAGGSVARYEEIPRFPAVKLDVALVVPREVAAETVASAIRSFGKPLLADVRLFDVYEDPHGAQQRRLPEGTKSLTFSLEYRAADRTLSEDEVRAVHDRLVERVCAKVGATLRA
ncbi:phenylalanine--tRNA ligase subunit beta [Coriobacteriia bacterium Es71-Z0120]|uniref:phenylalanine--tRNA ligase subunit beta n=1 Tax=Parvivirga hydrogeniphila TaxID=2939460 RepID=UPI00226101F6|nr:phenylalanine--tRNA ligase subunit beta [Parvivirga hydrogeniphila]MCL4079252.1 phenylalanine--tRNA ligase subunit beta [Parvivirga hydrogeniphila]